MTDGVAAKREVRSSFSDTHLQSGEFAQRLTKEDRKRQEERASARIMVKAFANYIWKQSLLWWHSTCKGGARSSYCIDYPLEVAVTSSANIRRCTVSTGSVYDLCMITMVSRPS